jgi:hypothetical protein
VWGIPMAFWLVMFAFFVIGGARRRRRWARWSADRRFGAPPWEQRQAAQLSSPERDAYIDQLETRVARLEERLDFTEKLLVDRSKPEHPHKVE